MDLSYYKLNYATLKRRGYNGNYTYFLTCHKYPVRMSGIEDIATLKRSHLVDRCYPTYDNLRFVSSVARSKSIVFQLVMNNPWDYYVTLTFSPELHDRYDLKNGIKTLLKFIDNYKQRKSPDFKYILIPELTKDGALHFHGFFRNLAKNDLFINEHGYLDIHSFREAFGFVNLQVIQNLDRCASYVTKYISKDMFNGNIAAKGQRLFYSSRGLSRDLLVDCGQLVLDPKYLNSADVIDSDFVVRYYCGDISSFKGYIKPFVNLFKMPSFAGDLTDYKIEVAKKYAIYNRFGQSYSDLDYLNLYNHIADVFLCDFVDTYSLLKERYKKQRTANKSTFDIDHLSADEIDYLETLFIAENVSLVPEFEQLSIFGDSYG